ncbi:MAG: LemA family protein [Rikenellaceae bacterium]|nr:LemA family protein [Rikenellaceae bacterium]
MKKTIWIIVAALVVIVCGYCWTTYNTLAKLGQGVEAAWADVETQYQRRSDLIPNLVKSVQGYAKHEKEALAQVVAARAKALAGSADIEEYAAAQQQVTTALGRLIAISESYPDLKANQNFLELQAQLEGTENRIAVARKKYNEIVKVYNTKTVTFPSNLIAKMFGFEKKQLFAATEGAEKAPKVAF